MEKRQRTVKLIKETRKVTAQARANLKEFNRAKKAILRDLASGAKTIPEIAASTGMSKSSVTYYLMTLLKYNKVEAGEMDDLDQYYYYRLIGG